MDIAAWGTVPVQVITTSIWRMTSLSLTTRKPSMLRGYTEIFPLVKAAQTLRKQLKTNGDNKLKENQYFLNYSYLVLFLTGVMRLNISAIILSIIYQKLKIFTDKL